ncbi:MAG: alpha/beta hydrolase [Myxococcota bacterium]
MSEPAAALIAPPERAKRFGLRPPSLWTWWLELRVVGEAALIVPAAPWLCAQPRGSGEDILVIPGYSTSDAATAPLRWYLRRLGYRAHPWGLGVNRGVPEKDAERLIERMDALPDRPLTVIGWSLGGVIARLVARARPDKISHVVTLGTPVEGGPKYTITANFFSDERNVDLDSFEAHVHKINSEGLSVPLTVIYSQCDAIVSWQASVDRYNSHARHIPLRWSSHTGLVLSPFVWATLAQALASADLN